MLDVAFKNANIKILQIHLCSFWFTWGIHKKSQIVCTQIQDTHQKELIPQIGLELQINNLDQLLAQERQQDIKDLC